MQTANIYTIAQQYKNIFYFNDSKHLTVKIVMFDCNSLKGCDLWFWHSLTFLLPFLQRVNSFDVTSSLHSIFIYPNYLDTSATYQTNTPE